MARPGDSLRHSLLILAAIGERLQTTNKLAGEDVRAEATHALVKLEALEDELLHQFNKNATPPMESMGKRKLTQLQGDGYVINGVALYHPETGQRALIDYLGYVGWVKPNEPSFTTGHCEHHNQPGGCHLHNLHCSYPKCDRKPKEPT